MLGRKDIRTWWLFTWLLSQSLPASCQLSLIASHLPTSWRSEWMAAVIWVRRQKDNIRTEGSISRTGSCRKETTAHESFVTPLPGYFIRLWGVREDGVCRSRISDSKGIVCRGILRACSSASSWTPAFRAWHTGDAQLLVENFFCVWFASWAILPCFCLGICMLLR